MFVATIRAAGGTEYFEIQIDTLLQNSARIQALNSLEPGQSLCALREVSDDPATDILDGTATGFGRTKKEDR